MVYTDRTISLKQMKELAQQVLPSSTVVLFGSRARSDFSADSDYDFMIIARDMLSTADKRRYKSILRKKFAEQRIPIDVLIETEDEVDIKRNISGHIVREVMRDGIVL